LRAEARYLLSLSTKATRRLTMIQWRAPDLLQIRPRPLEPMRSHRGQLMLLLKHAWTTDAQDGGSRSNRGGRWMLARPWPCSAVAETLIQQCSSSAICMQHAIRPEALLCSLSFSPGKTEPKTAKAHAPSPLCGPPTHPSSPLHHRHIRPRLSLHLHRRLGPGLFRFCPRWRSMLEH
jgi:hypothetical protein